MIEPATGDLLKAQVDALVNPVNCVGVMGKGLALQFKQAFPSNFTAYKTACGWNEVRPGQMFVHDTGLAQPKWIINFPTKRHWKDASKLDDIQTGLVDLVRVLQQRGISSIAVPQLGCGLGGLSWADVKPLIVAAVGALPGVRVLLFG